MAMWWIWLGLLVFGSPVCPINLLVMEYTILGGEVLWKSAAANLHLLVLLGYLVAPVKVVGRGSLSLWSMLYLAKSGGWCCRKPKAVVNIEVKWKLWDVRTTNLSTNKASSNATTSQNGWNWRIGGMLQYIQSYLGKSLFLKLPCS